MCFMLYLTKGKDVQKGCSTQYKELVSKVCTEAHGFHKNNSKSMLSGLLGSNSEIENNQSRSPRKNTSPTLGSKRETSLEKSLYSNERGVKSLVLDKVGSRILNEETEKFKNPGPEERRITGSPQQDIAEINMGTRKNDDKEGETKSGSTFSNKGFKKRRKVTNFADLSRI